jgi:prepilin-type N-terminal cleavage/methylation domain-containing protein
MGSSLSNAPRADAPRSSRRGFTLVELLVSMTIILILAGMTMAALSVSANGDRIPGAARQTQSMILGARDRAIYAGEPRGVRLISDPDNAMLINSFVFVGAPQTYGKGRGTVDVVEVDDGDPATVDWWVTEIDPSQSGFQRLFRRGLLVAGARIRVPADSTRWYTISQVADPDSDGLWSLRLSRPYTDANFGSLEYSVTLEAGPLPGEEPRLLPRGVVIDLQSSKVPVWWALSPERRDIMFNERGTAYGPLASTGVLSFHIADLADYAKGFRIGHPNSVTTPPDLDGDTAPDVREGDERILTFFASSGTIIVAPVDDADVFNNSDGSAGSDATRDDPYRIAETGGES